MQAVRAMLDLMRGRRLVALALVVALGAGFCVLRLQSGAAAAEAPPGVEAVRGDIVVSVGGVGRIVETNDLGTAVTPAAPGGTGSAQSSGIPAGAVFPRTSGHLAAFLVAAGQRVAAGQPLALLDAGGSARDAVEQAEIDLAIARLELRQKRTSDPANGARPTREELAAARLGVPAARARLARLLAPAPPAEVAAAKLDLQRAQADLETLLRGTPEARARAVHLAQAAVELAGQRLERVLAPASPADAAAAEAEVTRAEAELAALQKGPPLEAVAVAHQAVAVAQGSLIRAQSSGDPAEFDAARLELLKAQAELTALQRPAQSEQVAAAQKTVDAARLKLSRLQGAAEPSDVGAARFGLEQARSELRSLRAGPGAAARGAARQAVASAQVRLSQLLAGPAKADVVAARLDIRRAEADLAALRARGGPAASADVAVAELKRQSAEAKLARARAVGRLLTVRATSSGTVTALLAVPGAPVDPATPIATVSDLRRLAVGVDLSEFDIARVRTGLPAIVSVDALGGKRFRGKVLFAAPSGTDNGGIVTFPVRIDIPPAAGLRPGMNVSVRIVVAERRGVVQVPLEAVTRDEAERPIVQVLDAAGQPIPRRVRLGLANNENVEIAKGLRAGERVLLEESSAEA